MKTAVEYIVEQLFPKALSQEQYYHIEQAKKIEQEQIVNAHYQGYRSSIGTTEISEQYYNETFKQQEQ